MRIMSLFIRSYDLKILIDDLKKICDKVLLRAEQSGLMEVDIDVDFYRVLDDLYDLSSEKPEMVIGSFVDDWESLRKVLFEKNPPTILDIERLGNVMKILSDSIRYSGKTVI